MSSTGAGFDSTTHPGAPTSTNELPALRLVLVYPPEVAHGGALSRSATLWPGLILGRSQQAPCFCIAHGTVSRDHAVVERKFGSVLCVRDLESRNGTHVNGKQIANFAVPLAPQTVVRLGDVLGVVVDEIDDDFHSDDVLPGRGGRMAAARTTLSRAAADDAPLLVWGETGTGKERVATEVHRRSGRIGPFVAVNCAELGPQLIETQLFGHERGAFTGALAAKSGLFAAADRGTLFLDEIGELPLELQAKLLRVLQEGEVRPVGSVRSRKVDVRVIAATNRNLRQMVELDTFRQDLLARLSVWELALPALRERREDVFEWLTLLQQNDASHVGAAPRVDSGRPGERMMSELQFSPNVAEHLLLHPWPDNLRGLDRLTHRLAATGLDGPLGWRQATSLMPELFTPATDADESTLDGSFTEEGNSKNPPSPELHGGVSPGHKAKPHVRDSRPSREELLAVYEAHGRSIRATSRHFGKDRRQIYRWFSAYQLPRDASDD